MKISIKEMSYLAIVFFFSVALNPEWSANSLLWWGSFLSVVILMSASNNYRLIIKINMFKIWLMLFLGMCFISITYAINRPNSFNVIKTLIVLFIVLFLVDDQINSHEELEKYLKLFLISLLIMMIYVICNLDLNSFQLAQHGEATTGLWNGNDIGMKCALYIILMLYFLSNNKKILQKTILLITLLIPLVLLYYTASRKAILMVILGVSFFYYLKHPNKKIRNLIVICLGVYIVYTLMMNNVYLYKAIGWRIEGALALLNKSGQVDSSTLLRKRYIDIGIDAWKKSPFLGYGVANFSIINSYKTGHMTYSHNNFVEMLVGVGGIGFLVYYSYYIKLLFDYVKIYFKHRSSQILNVVAICFIIMFAMHFAVVSYYAVEQGIINLFMFKAIKLNKNVTYKSKTKGEEK